MERARAVLESITVVTLVRSTFERAAELEPELLRSLDALHLAAALELGDDLEGIVTYDDRLAEAAHRYGIPVIAPLAPLHRAGSPMFSGDAPTASSRGSPP